MTHPLLRRPYALALGTFRRLPPPVRRSLVRAGTPSFTVGAVAVIRHDNQVLFLRQPHREGWSLPGGLLDRGESAHEAVVREVREETGLQITVGVPSTCKVNPRVRRVDVIYVIDLDERPAVLPGGEAQDYAWLALPDLDEADEPTREIVATVVGLEPPTTSW